MAIQGVLQTECGASSGNREIALNKALYKRGFRQTVSS
jgi:hypothetical protein